MIVAPTRPGSNLRPVKFAVREEESSLARRLRELRCFLVQG